MLVRLIYKREKGMPLSAHEQGVLDEIMDEDKDLRPGRITYSGVDGRAKT